MMKKNPEQQILRNSSGLSFIINVNKPAGKSSFAVVSYIRRISGIKKVGHAGTLDPDASGVLLIVAGRATKQVEHLMNMEKEYIGTVHFGCVTDTYDSTGTIIEEHSTTGLTEQSIIKALSRFKGDIQQVPPRFSAIKHKGRPLYSYARKGEVIIPESRPVHIYNISLETFELPKATIRVVCSRGTYVRSIAHDLGQALGCGALLSELTRLRIGGYSLQDAVSWQEIPEKISSIINN